MGSVIKIFDLENTKKDLIEACLADVVSCTSIISNNSQFVATYNNVPLSGQPLVATNPVFHIANAQQKYDIKGLQLFPDVTLDVENFYYVNMATLLGIVQGYYQEEKSPFKPERIITRMEATKVILGGADLMKWLYYDELATQLGGDQYVLIQETPFSDIKVTTDKMWWYPRYVSKACSVGMFDCTQGSKFRPDEYITKAEVDAMVNNVKNYLGSSGTTARLVDDNDGDTLKNYLEESVYFTNPNKADTDDDGLRDDQELFVYKTSPFLKDTDGDGLSDADEVLVYKTNPLEADTDGDGYPDNIEVREKTDPADVLSLPKATGYQGVSDSWKEQYKITVTDGSQDSDHDGLTDVMEYQYGTDPLSPDSDNDGYPDALEVLDLGTDPLKPNTRVEIEELLKITNLKEGQLVGTSMPLIKGIAPLDSTVRLVLKNDFGHEKVLGDTTVDANHVFLFKVPKPIKDGRYIIVARALQLSKKAIKESEPVHIVVDSKLNVPAPVPKKIADQEISSDVLLKNLRVEIVNKRPVLYGSTELGNKVTASWRSIVMTSALVADSLGGEFAIMAPTDLAVGDHEVFVTATRKKDNAQSDTVRILFKVSPSFEQEQAQQMEAQQLRGVVEKSLARILPATMAKFIARNWFLVLMLGLLMVAIAGTIVYLLVGGRKKK